MGKTSGCQLHIKKSEENNNLQSAKHKRLLTTLLVLSFFTRILLGCALPEVPIGDVTSSPTATDFVEPTTTVTLTPSVTSSPIIPTFTQTVAETPEPVLTVTPTPTNEDGIPPGGVEDVKNPRFMLQPGIPVGMQNIIDPESGCNWLGLGGQALDSSGYPANNLVVEIGGQLEGENILELGLTGNAIMLGPGGYFVQLANRPIASEGSLWLQVFDLSGHPQSRKIYLTTYPECDRNLLLINFVERTISLSIQVAMPFVVKSR